MDIFNGPGVNPAGSYTFQERRKFDKIPVYPLRNSFYNDTIKNHEIMIPPEPVYRVYETHGQNSSREQISANRYFLSSFSQVRFSGFLG